MTKDVFEVNLTMHFRNAVKAINTRNKDWRKVAAKSTEAYIRCWLDHLIVDGVLPYLVYKLNVNRIGQRKIQLNLLVKLHPYCQPQEEFELIETLLSPREVCQHLLATAEDVIINKNTSTMSGRPTGLLKNYPI